MASATSRQRSLRRRSRWSIIGRGAKQNFDNDHRHRERDERQHQQCAAWHDRRLRLSFDDGRRQLREIDPARIKERWLDVCPTIYHGCLHRLLIRQHCRRRLIKRRCRHRVTPLGLINFPLNTVGNLMVSLGSAVSRPNNDPDHASRCMNQTADALRSCSCRTLKPLMAWIPPISTQRTPRHAWVAPSKQNKYRRYLNYRKV